MPPPSGADSLVTEVHDPISLLDGHEATPVVPEGHT